MRGRLFALRDLALGSVIPFLAVLMEALWAHAWLTWASGWQALQWDRPPLGILGAVTIAMTAQVVAGIHWQALKLWWKGVPVVPRATRDGVGERAACAAHGAGRTDS